MKNSLIGVSVFVLALLIAVPASAKPPAKGGHHPGHKPSHHPSHHQHHQHHHHHHHIRPGVVVPVQAAPLQEVRYLRVANQTGEPLTVYVRVGDGQTWNWTFAPDQTAYLAVDNERLTASEVFIWGSSSSKRWDSRRTEPLMLVAQPYQSPSIGTFTYTFNP